MFPELTAEELAALTDEQLAELIDNYIAEWSEARSAAVTAEDLAALTAGADEIDALRGELSTREAAAAELAASLDALATRVVGQDGDAGGEGEGNEGGENEGESAPGEVEPPADPGVETNVPPPGSNPSPQGQPQQPAQSRAAASTRRAAATTRPSVAELNARRSPAQARRPETAADRVQATIVAGADLEGHRPGDTLTSLRDVAAAMVDRWAHLGRGPADDVKVATFKLDFAGDFKFDSGSSEHANMRKLEELTQDPAIVAAGGLCAPTAGYYEQLVIAEAHRPVRDALPNFGADRGGIRFNPPPKLSQITSGVGTVTAAQDLAGGGGATKSCFDVTCPNITEVTITAIYNCLQFGNFGARTFPEQVEAWTKLALSLQARTSEQMLLDQIAANSVSVTSAGLVGAGRELLARLGQAATGYRSRNRMLPASPLTVLLPFWSIDLMRADFTRSFTDEPGLIGLTDEQIAAFFTIRHLNVSWYVDSKTGGGQVIGAANGGVTITDLATTSGSATVTSAAQAGFTAADVGRTITGAGIPAATTISAVASGTSATISANATATATGVTATIGRPVLAQFPNVLFAYMFAEGSFLHLDGGTLDLGLVRDSTLNSTNKFRMFTESFENLAFVGVESLEIALTLNADGTYGAAKTVPNPILT